MGLETKALDFASKDENSSGSGEPTTATGAVYLTDKAVAARYSINRKSVWRWHHDNPHFPRVVKLTPATSRWRLADLIAWETAGCPST